MAIALAALLWIGGHALLGWSGWSFEAATGYRSPLVWLIEKSASVLIILFVFYFLSALIPGEAGRQFRGLLARFCAESLRLIFLILQKAVESIFRLLTKGATKR